MRSCDLVSRGGIPRGLSSLIPYTPTNGTPPYGSSINRSGYARRWQATEHLKKQNGKGNSILVQPALSLRNNLGMAQLLLTVTLPDVTFKTFVETSNIASKTRDSGKLNFAS